MAEMFLCAMVGLVGAFVGLGLTNGNPLGGLIGFLAGFFLMAKVMSG